MKTRTTLLALLALASSARAQEENESAMRGVVHQRFVALLNPMGMEHTLSVGLRGALGDQDELLFMGAHAETGLISYVSPVFVQNGGYVEVSPLSFLVLRGELVHQVLWPIGMEGAGYYALDGYELRQEELAPENGESAQGWAGRLSATAQGLVPIGPTRLLLYDQLTAQYASLGSGSHYYDMKWDLVLAREDWVLVNSAAVLLEVDLGADVALRFGAYDEVRFVPASGYVGHQVGAIAMLEVENAAPEVPSITPFVRGGYYTSHVQRADEWTILGGVAIDYDLGAVR